MSELHCPYCGFNCEIPSDTEGKIECLNCGSIFLYIQQSKSHGEIDYRPSPEINDGRRQMSELKVYHHELRHNEYEEFYLKYEADKVIADLEESHKKEVEQLLMEIAELQADYKEACGRLQTANLIKDEQLIATRHSKYKRCLNKAEWCEERSARYDALQERTGFDWSREIGFYFKWQQRWLELAEKFKEAK